MNVLVIEDEPLAAKRLTRIIQRFRPDYVIRQILDTVRDSVAYLKEHAGTLSLVFCDIRLADGLSFAIFQEIKVSIPVIFTTAYDMYPLNALHSNGIHYLLKPIQEEDVEQAIQKFESLIGNAAPNLSPFITKQLAALSGETKQKRLLAKRGVYTVPKQLSDIALLFINDVKLTQMLDINDGQVFTLDQSLQTLEEQFLDPALFFRINRQEIVQMDAIEAFKSYTNSRLLVQLRLPHKSDLIVSRERVNAFKLWFTE